MTIFIRFPDEATAQTVLTDYYSAELGWNTASLVHALDPIGTLYNDDAVIGDDGNVISPETTMEGWHVNFIGELPEAAKAYVITPLNPRVVFAS